MADEVYEQRNDTIRKFLKNLQSTRPELFQQQQQQQQQQQESEEDIRAKFPIGARCMLPGDRRGQIAFVGVRPSQQEGQIWI
ncbi:tubulin-specific chaperone, putative, partial [Eimeria tenella]